MNAHSKTKHYCPCGRPAIGVSNNVFVCAHCKAIETRLKATDLKKALVKTEEEKRQRIQRNREDYYLACQPQSSLNPTLTLLRDEYFMLRAFGTYQLKI